MHDIVTRDGVVIDGSGGTRFRADVAITAGKIVEVGQVDDSAHEEIDAGDLVVTPGFIDGHTHMDAQVFWDPAGSSSCYHGVTSVVMGNCGFTLAPAHDDARSLVLANLERAEDIPLDVMTAGIDWTWQTFAEYLAAVERQPKAINYATAVGHSALRTWAMGERAFDEPASEADMRAMTRELRSAISAGAIGFSTSRTSQHLTPDGRPVASRVATWDEVRRLTTTMRDAGGRMLEIALELGNESAPAVQSDEDCRRLHDLAVETGAVVTFGAPPLRAGDRHLLDLIERTLADGGAMYGQSHSRGVSSLLSFRTRLPFDRLPEWSELRALPLEEQAVVLRDPEHRRRLVNAAVNSSIPDGVAAETRRPDYDKIRVLDQPLPPNPTVRQVADARGVHPVEAMILLALESNFDQFFVQPLSLCDHDELLTFLRHPGTVMTFSDSGAHVSQIMDSSIQTHFLAHWVRAEGAFTLEEGVRMLTSVPARIWGFHDRGRIAVGAAADINVFDPATVGPCMPQVVDDLPAGGRRLVQNAQGIEVTVVGGAVTLRRGQPTGARSGQLLRGPFK